MSFPRNRWNIKILAPHKLGLKVLHDSTLGISWNGRQFPIEHEASTTPPLHPPKNIMFFDRSALVWLNKWMIYPWLKHLWMMLSHQITHGTQVISDRFGDCKGVVEAVALASIVSFAEPNGFVFKIWTWTQPEYSSSFQKCMKKADPPSPSPSWHWGQHGQGKVDDLACSGSHVEGTDVLFLRVGRVSSGKGGIIQLEMVWMIFVVGLAL